MTDDATERPAGAPRRGRIVVPSNDAARMVSAAQAARAIFPAAAGRPTAWTALSSQRVWTPKAPIWPTKPANFLPIPRSNFATALSSNARKGIVDSFSFGSFGASPSNWFPAAVIDFDALERALLPENLRVADIDFEPERWLEWISEGIPVAYVLDPATLELLDQTDTPAERRAVLGRRWKQLLRHSEALLGGASATAIETFVQPAQRSVDGIRAGFPDLAQAYAANTLDTMVRSLYSNPERIRWVQKSGAPDEPGGFRNALYFRQLQAVHTSFRDGPAPATFNRHGSAHAVGRGRQYSRLNAVLGTAHLISAMWKHELDARHLHARRSR